MPRTKVFNEGDTATSDDSAAQNGSGWETDSVTPIGSTTECGKSGAQYKRHHFIDGICDHCGSTKSAKQPRNESENTRTPRTRAGASGSLETAISYAWMGMGIGLEKQPWVLAEPVLTDGKESAPVSVAVGKVLQLESAIAGKRIDKVLRGTVVGKIISAWLSQAGPWAELAPLIIPPLVVGLAAARPDMAEKFRPMMVALLVPVLVEAAKMAEQQAALVGNLSDLNEETMRQASAVVDELLGLRKD